MTSLCLDAVLIAQKVTGLALVDTEFINVWAQGEKIESNWRGILLHHLASQIIVYPSCFSTSTYF